MAWKAPLVQIGDASISNKTARIIGGRRVCFSRFFARLASIRIGEETTIGGWAGGQQNGLIVLNRSDDLLAAILARIRALRISFNGDAQGSAKGDSG